MTKKQVAKSTKKSAATKKSAPKKSAATKKSTAKKKVVAPKKTTKKEKVLRVTLPKSENSDLERAKAQLKKAMSESAKKSNKALKINVSKKNLVETIDMKVDELMAFVSNENNTRYMRLKSSCYIEALEAFKAYIEGDLDALSCLNL